jgi:hypothetical protein
VKSVLSWLKTPYQPLIHTDYTDWGLSVCHTLLEHIRSVNYQIRDYERKRSKAVGIKSAPRDGYADATNSGSPL